MDDFSLNTSRADIDKTREEYLGRHIHDGYAYVLERFHTPVHASNRKCAKEIGSVRSREELIEYVVQMLDGIDDIKQEFFNRHMFGRRSNWQ